MARIDVQMNFTANKNSLNDIKATLQQINKMTTQDFMSMNKELNTQQAVQQLTQLKSTVSDIQNALEKAFNVNLNSINVSKFNQELQKSGLNINQIYKTLHQFGSTGDSAFRRLAANVLTTNTQLKESHKILDEIASTMSNTIKWGVTSSIFNSMSSSIQRAFEYTKQLDTSLNDIRIVTGYSAEQMDKFAQSANRAAQSLGASTRDYTDASLIYYQQGLNDAEVQARTETTLKAANVTGQTGDEVSEQLTAIWNGYKVTADETELYIDKVAKVAAATAADLEELSTGMSKVASAANSAGVDIDQLNATLATVISVTREAPETVGTAFRSIYARLGDLALDGEDEFGVSLGTVSGQMEELGIQILDEQGQMRDMGDIIEDTAAKWQTWTQAQRQAAAVAMAGKQQYSRLIALFDNWDMYTKALNESQNAMGTLDEQQSIYMESTAAHIQELTTSWERLADAFIDQNGINTLLDGLTSAVNLMANFVEATGGGVKTLTTLGSIAAQVFNKQLTQGLGTTIGNFRGNIENRQALEDRRKELLEIQQSEGANNPVVAETIKNVESELQYYDILTEEQRKTTEELIRESSQIRDIQQQWEEAKNKAMQYAEQITKNKITDIQDLDLVENQDLNIAMEEVDKSIGRIQSKVKDLSNSKYPEDWTDAFGELVIEANDFQDVLNIDKDSNFSKSLKNITDIFEKESFGNITKAMSGDSDFSKLKDDINNNLDEVINGIKTYSQKASDNVKNIDNVVKQEINSTVSQTDKIANQVGDVTNKLAENNKKIKDLGMAETFTNMATGALQLLSVWTSLSNLPSIFNNEDLTTGEKIVQVLMSIGIATISAIEGFTNLSNSFKTLSEIGPDVTALLTTKIAQMAGLTTASTTAAAGEAALTGAETAQGIAAAGATAPTITLAAAVQALMLQLLPIIAVIAAVTGAVYLAVSAYNADADAALKAAEASQELKDSNQELEQSFTELQSTFDTYETALEKLNECIKGTEEWNEALKEVNNSAIEVLNSLSGLSAQDIRDLYSRDESTGQLVINEDKMNKLMEQQQNMVNASDFAVAAGEETANDAQVKSDILNLTRDMSEEMYGTGSSIAETYAQINQDVLLNNLEQFEDTSTLDEFKSKLENLGINIQFLDDNELQTFKTRLEELANSAAAADEKFRLIAETNVEQALGDAYNAATKEIVSTQLTADQEKRAKELEDRYTGWGINQTSGSNNEIYQEALKGLQEAGYTYTAQTKNAVRGGDNSREFAFLDENGEEVVKSAQWVAQTVAAAESLEKLSGNAEQASQALLNLDRNVGEDISEGIKGWITNQNFESMNQQDFETLKNEVGTDVTGYLTKNLGVDENQLKIMLGEDYVQKFQDALNNYDTALSSFTDNLLQDTQDAFNNIDDKEVLSVEGQKSIAQAIQNALVYGSEDSAQTISDTFNKLDTTNIEGFTDIFSSITDWSNTEVSDLSKQLKDAGVQTNFTTEELANFIMAMRDTQNAAADSVENLTKNYAEIHSIIDDLEYGDSISQEDYNKLGDAAKTYFTMMLDGTYKLTGDAEDFYNLVQDKLISDFQAKKDEYDDNVQQLNSIRGYDINSLSQQQDISNISGINQQLNVLSAFDFDANKVAKWQEQIENNSMTTESLKEISDEVGKLRENFNNLDSAIEENQSQFYTLDLAIAESYTNLSDLREAYENNEIGAQAYTKAVEDLTEAERREDLDAEEIQDYADYIVDIADKTSEFSDDLLDNEDAAEDLAVQILNMTDGIEDLADNWEDWSDILKNSSKTSEEYYDALEGTKEAMSDLLDISEEYISEDLILNNMNDIAKAAEGDANAIDRLRAAALEDIVLNMKLDDSAISNQELFTKVQGLQSMLDQMGDLQVGANIDDSEFIQACNDMILAAGLSADQVNALFSGMGFDVTYDSEPQKVTTTIPTYITHHEITNRKTETMEGGTTVETFDEKTWTEQGEPVIQEGETTAFAMQTSEPGTTVVPKINSLTKKATGSYNNYSSKNKGGGSPSGKSGGGGSKGSQPKEPDKKDLVESEKDRYHDINIELEQIQTNLDRLDKQRDKLFGKDLIDNLNKQLETLNQQIDATNEKLVIARGELSELRAELSQKGVTFNDDGTIANYSAAYDSQLNYVNSIINKYNSMSAEAQETYKETVKQAQEDFDKFVENIERYDELVSSEIPGLEDDIQDAIDKQIEIQIEKFNMEIEIRLDLAEAERDWNEFKKNVIDQIDEDDILGNAEARLEDFFSYYKDDGTGIVQRNTVHIEDILTQLKQMDNTGWSDVYGDNRAQALEDLQTYYEQMMEDLQDLEELQDEIHESYLDMIDEAQDKFDEQIDTFEQITSLIEHDMDLIELINGEESYSELANYYEKLEDNYNKQLDFQRQQVEFWKQQMDLAEQGSEEWEAARDNWMDAVDDWRSTVEDAVENVTDKYVNAINEIFQNLNDKVTNGMGLDYVEEEWNLINENADQYLDTINSMYGIQDLENKYLDAIDQTDNISAQQKLNDLMQEELAALQEKDKLTQYDIDRANMKYEIALKQIALEEAQQNKSQLRLRRDSQGNYSYQFVSDESEIGQLKDELNELYNQLYNFDLEHYRDNLDQIYSVWVEYQEKMAEAAQINDPEKRAQKEALLQEQYGELINGLVEQNETIRLNLHESAFTELAELYDIDLENFKQLSEEQKDILLGDMIPQWTSGVQDMADVFAGEDGFTNVCKDAMEDLKEATEDYEQSLEDIESTAGISFDTILDGTDNIINQTEDLLWENDELINSYEDQLDAIRDIINELSSLIAKYNAAREAAITATEAAYKYWQEQQRQAAAEAAKENANSGASSNSGSSNSGSSGGGKGSGGGDGVLNVGDTVTYTGGTYYYDSYGTSPAGNRGPGKKVTVTQVKEDGRPYPIHVQSNNSAYGWLKRSQLSGYDTGGYTGDWGDNSGKLALLHKKELVLNRNDTSNLLQGIQILRNIVDSVGSSMISRMANLTSNIGINSNVPTSSDTLEQNVHIEANFPNVESSKEIEDALNNLVNVASQRVHRRR